MSPREAFFLEAGPGRRGRRLCVHHAPAAAARAAAVYVHPFAEEMNKSRRMAGLAARALAAQGVAVLQIDLAGCGDSSGDLADASWQDWVDDVLQAGNWLRQRYGEVPQWFWGLRAGALLAAEAARKVPEAAPSLLLWQPQTTGRAVLQPFFRLKTMGALARGGAGGEPGGDAGDDPRAALAAGRCAEVAGYRLPPAVAQGLESARLEWPGAMPRLVWLELQPRADVELMPASAAPLERARGQGANVHAQALRGPGFWQSVEIEDAPALVEATVAALSG